MKDDWAQKFRENEEFMCSLLFIFAYVILILAALMTVSAFLIFAGYIVPIFATMVFVILLYAMRKYKDTFRGLLCKYKLIIFLWMFAIVTQEFLLPWWSNLG